MKRSVPLLLSVLVVAGLIEPEAAGDPIGRIGAIGPMASEPVRPGRLAPDGTEPQVDFPAEQWIRNIGSRLDGAGMCVFSSWEMMCRFAGLECFRGFRDWCAQNYRGGGYPTKLDALIRAWCQAKNLAKADFDPDQDFWQYEGPSADAAIEALKSGRMVQSTLYRSPRYRWKVYHMVNLAHFDQHRFAVLDNNGNDHYDWGRAEQALSWLTEGRRIWLVGLRRPGPPPSPTN